MSSLVRWPLRIKLHNILIVNGNKPVKTTAVLSAVFADELFTQKFNRSSPQYCYSLCLYTFCPKNNSPKSIQINIYFVQLFFFTVNYCYCLRTQVVVIFDLFHKSCEDSCKHFITVLVVVTMNVRHEKWNKPQSFLTKAKYVHHFVRVKLNCITV